MHHKGGVCVGLWWCSQVGSPQTTHQGGQSVAHCGSRVSRPRVLGAVCTLPRWASGRGCCATLTGVVLKRKVLESGSVWAGAVVAGGLAVLSRDWDTPVYVYVRQAHVSGGHNGGGTPLRPSLVR